MTAEQFLIQKLNPKSGNLKTGIMNTSFAAELLEEYAKLYHKAQGKDSKAFDEYKQGVADGRKSQTQDIINGLQITLEKLKP